MTKRCFITGISAVTSCGMDLEETWSAIKQGQTGIAPIEQLPLKDWEYPLGGELKQYKPRTMLPDKKLLKVISRQDVIGINAACQAVDSSGFIAFRDSLADVEDFNNKTGVYAASPGNKYCQQYDFLSLIAQSDGDMKVFAEKLFESVHPMWLLRILPNNVLAYTGITYGFKGVNHNIANHAVSSLQAVNEACHAIKQGVIDRAVVVGYDMGMEAQAVINYAQTGLISKKGLHAFSAEHDGTVLAEGAGAIVIESEQAVAERQGKVFAEVLTGFSRTGRGGIFSIEHQAQTLTELVQSSLAQYKLSATDIGCVTLHGNGNPASDNSEALMYQRVFEHSDPVVASFKWAVGHTLAAAGLIDTVMTVKAMAEQQVPGHPYLEQKAKPCHPLNISSSEQALTKSTALVINRGFGAMDASVILKAHD